MMDEEGSCQCIVQVHQNKVHDKIPVCEANEVVQGPRVAADEINGALAV
eukprot:CAMPEP_0184495270 /NCGR_PEP_ID=MMETSP0113_2-20130426/30827_1 /TAXON_ID=91329 /ORGANISM="Norrisiella sphaerica, Strain BC52" /LENGTH=48 /DNA_ID= /DNA_START= /DNA_END= /DNA_ORIENTATION=